MVIPCMLYSRFFFFFLGGGGGVDREREGAGTQVILELIKAAMPVIFIMLTNIRN